MLGEAGSQSSAAGVKHLLCSLQRCWVDLLLTPITQVGELRLGKAEALRHGLLPSLETPSIGSPDPDEGGLGGPENTSEAPTA